MARPPDSDGSLEKPKEHLLTEMRDTKQSIEALYAYRDRLRRFTTWLAVFRGIVSSASIGAWAVWQKYPLLWGFAIAVSQVTDAVLHVTPLVKSEEAASHLADRLTVLLNTTEVTWYRIFDGTIRSATEIRRAALAHSASRLAAVQGEKHLNFRLKPGSGEMRDAAAQAEAYIARVALGGGRVGT